MSAFDCYSHDIRHAESAAEAAYIGKAAATDFDGLNWLEAMQVCEMASNVAVALRDGLDVC